ncbi:NIN-like protein [Artemisia annua]|uniref:NIN-like protein n=1 Tax=Artemisia annua TaxID=35608 RepID=A0A2U1KZX3_ARTAN|nr:NIN-like protein [Artemisia annua]
MMVEPNTIDPHAIKERITSALKDFRFRDKGVLVQFWSPVAVRNRWLLTTWDQPFGVGGADEGLYSFRLKSELHAIVVDVEDTEELRPPGRVYSQKLPEWSFDVDGWGNKYGYIDLPVFESSGDSCVGVLEIITSSNYVDYAFEVQEVSRALKSELHAIVVDVEDTEELRPPGRVYSQKLPEWSFDVDGWGNKYGYIDLPVFESSGDSCVGVLEIITSSNYVDYAFEVQEVLRALKRSQLQPIYFGLTVFVRRTDERRRYELDGILKVLKAVCDDQELPLAQTWSLSGHASFVANSGNIEHSCSSFNRSCIGKVCLSTDITALDEDNYPLVPFAREIGLTSCLAIYITSLELGVEYVIEFFLPHSTDDADVQRLMKAVKQQIQNTSCMRVDIMSAPQVIGGLPFLSWDLDTPPLPITLLTEKGAPQDSEDMEEENMENEPSNSHVVGTSQSIAPYLEQGIGNSDTNPGKVRKKRKRKSSESSITLEKIQKHFGKTMDEAAATLNVSRSTLKRICRNHGIPRWPYRIGTDKSDSPMKSGQTDIVVHTSDSSLAPIFGVSSGRLGTTTVTHDPATLIEQGKHASLTRTNPPDETIVASSVENVVIKAIYEKNTVKFPFYILDGLVKLKELIATRFQLEHESFRLQYRDEDGDMILILCDNDISHAILSSSEPPDSKALIKLFVQLVDNQSFNA